jgi:uncharacterized radical SAM superfamily Fe-S cluster-containing enzyme
MAKCRVLVCQHFGSTVFDRHTSRYYPFDRRATDLLLSLRSNSIDALFAASDQQTRAALWEFYERFHPFGFFTLDGHFAGDVLDNHVPPNHLAGPLAVHLEIVAACNLTCRHCFAGTLPRHERPLTLAELDGLFATLAAMGCFRLGLTGGEPTLRHDYLKSSIRDVARAAPVPDHKRVNADRGMAREFGKRMCGSVSPDGAPRTPTTTSRRRNL